MTKAEIQLALIALGRDLGPAGADGKFGPDTKRAVEVFQTRYGLVVDGDPGRQTIAALKQALTAAKPGRPEPDKSAMALTCVVVMLAMSAEAQTLGDSLLGVFRSYLIELAGIFVAALAAWLFKLIRESSGSTSRRAIPRRSRPR